MEFHLRDGEDVCEHNGIGGVEICNIFVTQCVFFVDREPSDRV